MLLLLLLLLLFFGNGKFHNIISTLTNIVKFDVEKYNVVSRLSNVFCINVEMRNVDSMLFDVVNSNVRIHNVVPRHEVISSKTQHWNNVKMFAGNVPVAFWSTKNLEDTMLPVNYWGGWSSFSELPKSCHQWGLTFQLTISFIPTKITANLRVDVPVASRAT